MRVCERTSDGCGRARFIGRNEGMKLMTEEAAAVAGRMLKPLLPLHEHWEVAPSPAAGDGGGVPGRVEGGRKSGKRREETGREREEE